MGLGRGAHRRGEVGTTYVLCSRLSLSLAHMCYVFATSIYSVQGYVRTRARERGGREGGGRVFVFFFIRRKMTLIVGRILVQMTTRLFPEAAAAHFVRLAFLRDVGHFSRQI